MFSKKHEEKLVLIEAELSMGSERHPMKEYVSCKDIRNLLDHLMKHTERLGIRNVKVEFLGKIVHLGDK